MMTPDVTIPEVFDESEKRWMQRARLSRPSSLKVALRSAMTRITAVRDEAERALDPELMDAALERKVAYCQGRRDALAAILEQLEGS